MNEQANLHKKRQNSETFRENERHVRRKREESKPIRTGKRKRSLTEQVLYTEHIQSKLDLDLEHFLRDSGSPFVSSNRIVIPLLDMVLLHEHKSNEHFSFDLMPDGAPIYYTFAYQTALAKFAYSGNTWTVKKYNEKAAKERRKLVGKEEGVKNMKGFMSVAFRRVYKSTV